MIELKFRAWKHNTKKMEEVFELHFWNDGSVEPISVNGMCGVDRKMWTLMQFTGLKDKNGKEIYENDVVGTVYWDKTKTNVSEPGWTIGTVLFRNGAFRIHAYLLCEVAEFCEIIGNIYENPDLLEAK